MKLSLRDIPVYRAMTSTVAAEHYNRMRLALLRLENPLRIPLPELHGLDMLVEDEAWIVVDRGLEEMPVLAWSHFHTRGRAGLHLPVSCRLRYFHAHAGLLVEAVLAGAGQYISRRLIARHPHVPRRVTPLRPAG